MKYLFLLMIIPLLSNCSKKTIHSMTENEIKNVGFSPDNGSSKYELIKNKSIEQKTDEFGRIYYELQDSMTKNVVVFVYNQNEVKGVQDGAYREEIVIEIDRNPADIDLEDNDLQQSKMLFGRFCYCKGQTGYYKIEKGNFEIISNGNQKMVSLDFEITAVPQIIKNLKFSM